MQRGQSKLTIQALSEGVMTAHDEQGHGAHYHVNGALDSCLPGILVPVRPLDAGKRGSRRRVKALETRIYDFCKYALWSPTPRLLTIVGPSIATRDAIGT